MTNLGEHYGQEGLVERILGQLAAAGIDPDGLTPTHLVAPTQIVARR